MPQVRDESQDSSGPLKNKSIILPKLKTVIPGDKRGSRLYYDLRLYLELEWSETVRAYEANPSSFYNAWRYLDNHPIYWQLSRYPGKNDVPRQHMRNLDHGNGFGNGGIWMSVERVDVTGKVSRDPALNRRTEVWLETGEWSWAESEHGASHYHNYKLDCGGPTYEAAVVKMARNVHRFYGNDRRRCEPEYSERRRRRWNKKSRFKVIKTRPYAHACRHTYPPGLEGILAKSADEIRSEKGKGDG